MENLQYGKKKYYQSRVVFTQNSSIIIRQIGMKENKFFFLLFYIRRKSERRESNTIWQRKKGVIFMYYLFFKICKANLIIESLKIFFPPFTLQFGGKKIQWVLPNFFSFPIFFFFSPIKELGISSVQYSHFIAPVY